MRALFCHYLETKEAHAETENTRQCDGETRQECNLNVSHSFALKKWGRKQKGNRREPVRVKNTALILDDRDLFGCATLGKV